jgi:hypothetical protein
MERNNLGTTGLLAINEAINELAKVPAPGADVAARLRSAEQLLAIIQSQNLNIGDGFFGTLSTIEKDPQGAAAMRTLRNAVAAYLERPWNTFELAGYEGPAYECTVSVDGLYAVVVVPYDTSCAAPDDLPKLPTPRRGGTTGARTLNQYALEDTGHIREFLRTWLEAGADINKLPPAFTGEGLCDQFWKNARLFPNGLLKKLCRELLEVWDDGVEISLVKTGGPNHELKPKVFRKRLEFPDYGDAWIVAVHVPSAKACDD